MQFTVKQIAELIEGKVIGNEELLINNFAKIEEGRSGDICFLSNKNYLNYIYTCNATAVIIDEKFNLEKEIKPTLIRVKNAQEKFAILLRFYQNQIKNDLEAGYFDKSKAFIHPTAEINSTAKIGNFCYVGAGVKIGKNSFIYPNTTIYNNCTIGDNCIIHSNSVIGSDGFGFQPDENGNYIKVPQLGNVVIGNDVEIGSNVSIDKATIGSTVIEDGVKLDNLIQVGHNVVIQKNTVIAAQTGIAGSTKIEANCIIGGQVGIVGHIKIAKGSKIQAQSGIASSIKEENKAWNDSPAFDYRNALKSQVIYRTLPSLLKRIEVLEKEISVNKSAKNI